MKYLRWSDFLGYIIIRCQGVNVKPIRCQGCGVVLGWWGGVWSLLWCCWFDFVRIMLLLSRCKD